jgi:hypothetical protein
MNTIFHWAGLALALLFVGWAFVGFWRGLSLKRANPETTRGVADAVAFLRDIGRLP